MALTTEGTPIAVLAPSTISIATLRIWPGRVIVRLGLVAPPVKVLTRSNTNTVGDGPATYRRLCMESSAMPATDKLIIPLIGVIITLGVFVPSAVLAVNRLIWLLALVVSVVFET